MDKFFVDNTNVKLIEVPAYSVQPNDQTLIIYHTNCVIYLPSGEEGRCLQLKDGTYKSLTNPIIIKPRENELINGESELYINWSGAGLRIMFSDGQWICYDDYATLGKLILNQNHICNSDICYDEIVLKSGNFSKYIDIQNERLICYKGNKSIKVEIISNIDASIVFSDGRKFNSKSFITTLNHNNSFSVVSLNVNDKSTLTVIEIN